MKWLNGLNKNLQTCFKKSNWQKLTGWFLGLAFFVIGVWTLPHYGINWDTPNHLLRGQVYLHYFLTGEKSYDSLPLGKVYFQDPKSLRPSVEIMEERRSLYQAFGYDYQAITSLENVFIDVGHPPLGGIFSSLTNYIFFQKLGWVNDIDAYHLYGIFLASFLIWLIWHWANKLWGSFAGLIASLSLFLYPLFLGESHFNTEKDIPETVFFTIVIFTFWKGIVKKSWRWLVVSSFFCGLALATKLNIVFASLIVIPWLIIYSWPKIKRLKWPFKRSVTLSLFFYPILPILIFFLSWPRQWVDPFAGFLETLGYYQEIGTVASPETRFLTIFNINTYPLQWILFTTPLIILFYFLIGFLASLKSNLFKENKNVLLIILWLLVPIARVAAPRMGIYGGVRQIMEYIPAMALLSGLGAEKLRAWLSKKLKTKQYLLITASILSFLPITLKMIEIHPNENVYFNPLIGGLKGAKERKIPAAGNTFGNAYRQGMNWINENVEEEAELSFAYEMMSNIPSIWVRPDIQFSNLYRSGFLRQGEYVISLVYEDKAFTKSYFGRYLKRFLNPIYEVKVDDVSVLNVWRNNEAYTKPEYLSEEKISGIKFEVEDNEITFDLGKAVFLSRIELWLNERNCSPLKSGKFFLADDQEEWRMMPEILPLGWPVVALGDQPANGKLIYPFAAELARFIRIDVSPSDSCVKKIIRADVFELPKLRQ